MLPSFLIQALVALGGVCFLIAATIFHYFRDRVNQYVRARLSELFSSSTIDEVLQMLREGSIPSTMMKDFTDELFKIVKPRRRLLSMLLFFPIAGGLLILSASLASVAVIENEMIIPIGDKLEFLADSALLIAFVVIVYCGFQLVRLSRELA